MLNIYIAKRYTSPSTTEPRARPPDQFPPRAAPSAGQSWLAPRWSRAMWSKPRPHRADAAPTKTTDFARPRPRVTQSFFAVRSAISIKHQLFFSFWSIILLHHLLQCVGIFVLLLKHFRGLSHFSVAIINSSILAIEVSHFMILSSILL
jgi:hypothetical protein